MSLRIHHAFMLACASLIAGSAAADPECFDGSCRMPIVVDPPAAMAEQPGMDDATSRAQVPAHDRPQMVVDPATRQAVPQAPRYSADAGPRRPLQPAPSYDERADGPVRVVNQGPVYSGRAPSAAHDAAQTPSYPGAGAMVVASGALQPEYGGLPVYPYLRPDPAWKLCQIDAPPRGARVHYYCGPYSYHPYGANGYRPYGSYRPYRSAPVYVYAPDARVLYIESDD